MPNEHLRSLERLIYKTRDAEPLSLTEGQIEVYEAIVTWSHPCLARYDLCPVWEIGNGRPGSLTVVSNYPEKFAIIAGKKDRAQIIMDYAISRVFDNETDQEPVRPWARARTSTTSGGIRLCLIEQRASLPVCPEKA